MSDNLYKLNEKDIRDRLFEVDYVFKLLDLTQSEIMAFYRQKCEINPGIKYYKDLYLTKDNIIIVELKSIQENDASIKLIPIHSLILDSAEFKLNINQSFEFDTINLTLSDISLGENLDNIIEKPVTTTGDISFHNNYLHFKKELINLIIKK